jgi:hypothetical protein
LLQARVGRIDDDMPDRAARRAQQARPDARRPARSSPFQKMLELFKGGDGGLKRPRAERKEETGTEDRKKSAAKRPSRGGGGESSGRGQQEGDEDPDDEATILEDPSIVERPAIPEGDFRYNPALHAAIALPKSGGVAPDSAPALATEIAREIAAKLGGKSAGELRFNLRTAPVKGLCVRARISDKGVEVLVWGADAGTLGQLKEIAAPLKAELKALGFEVSALSTAQAG